MVMKCDVDLLVKVFLLMLFTNEFNCQKVNHACIIKITGQSGICKLPYDCPEVEEQAQKGIPPTICGFHQLTTPIVCCEKKVQQQETKINTLTPESDIIFPDDGQISFVNSLKTRGKSEKKCQEYSKNVTAVIRVIPLVSDPKPIKINVTKCWDSSSPLIVGGTPAYPGEFPFMALIGFNSDNSEPRWGCGGTLISDRWVVTAAHCTYSLDLGEPKIIRLGELDYTRTDDADHADYAISKILIHPEYSYPKKYNDIALMSSATKMKFSNSIRPACLYTKMKIDQNEAIATGWGQTDYGGDNSNKLMKVSLNIYPNSECSRAYKNERQVPNGIVESMLCAGELRGGKDTCFGDSGGPLVITDTQNWCKFYIIGITSFGKLCAQVNTPAVYTRISEYIDWIEENVWK